MKYPEAEVARLGAQGLAIKLPDGEWGVPIVNEEDLKTAIVEFTTAGVEFDYVRKFIVRRATELGLVHTIPITWEPDGSLRPQGGTTDGRSHVMDSLVRAYIADDALLLRDAQGNAAGDGNVLVGTFAVFNRWTEINSPIEGHFMERIAPGAFDASFAARKPKVLFQHGKDPSIGIKPLGTVRSLTSDEDGAHYEVDLFDTSYNRDLKPALAAGEYGASFRFGIRSDGDDWTDRPMRSEYNPNAIPEVTRTALDVYEFGPVTFGQYPEATSGLRCMTDDFAERMLGDPLFLARLVDRAGLKNIEPLIEAARGAAGANGEQEQEEEDPSGGAADETIDLAERRAFLARLY